jgi:hypothetical protein
MEHLTKQQIVLLTLLVSFVTSLSTGIVTVSLMDQAPVGVTRTINQVIEKTIQEAAPTQTASVGIVDIAVDDELASSTALVSSSTVDIKDLATGNVVGLGLIKSKNGLIITDKSVVDPTRAYEAVLSNGTVISIISSTMTQSSDSSLAYFIPTGGYADGALMSFAPISLASSYSLGQKVLSLIGTSTIGLQDGIISRIASSSMDISIPPDVETPGSPIFDAKGEVIGIWASSTIDILAN